MAIFSMILSLLCGVSLFLFGMSLMGDGLKLAAGNKLEAFLYKMTNTPLKGVALGTGVTSVIQSSSATTVMVIGFVNSGMSEELEARLRGRHTETEEAIQKRLASIKLEIENSKKFDYQVVNDTVENAVLNLEKILL